MDKETKTPGAFIRKVIYKRGKLKGQTRYLVMRPGRGRKPAAERKHKAAKLRAERSARRRRRERLEEAPF